MKKLVHSLLIGSVFCLGAFEPTIPVLHLPDYKNPQTRSQFLATLEEALREVGFFALTGTGIDPNLLDCAYEEIVSYFKESTESKMALKTLDGQRGYVPGESAKGETRIDCKEFFHVGRELSEIDFQRLQYARNVWPESPQNFKPLMQSLYQAMDKSKIAIGEMLSHLCSQDLNEMILEGDCLMRAIHYPENPPEDAIWAAAHTDINFFTILPRSTAKGLQVLDRRGIWIDAIVPDDAFIINSGDMLENLTNGYFRSAQHRVIDTSGIHPRYSVVFFVHPRSPDRLDPLPAFIEKTGGVRKYANINRIELLAERLIDLGLASCDLMDFFVNSGAIERLKEVDRFSLKAKETLRNAGFILE